MITELLITLAVTVIVYAYTIYKSRYAYFKNRDVKNFPVVPLLGNVKDSLLGLRHLAYIFDDFYKAFPSERIVGFFELLSPRYLIRDPELIKQIAVKDFDHFVDHRTIFSEEADKIFTNSLIALKGDKWREMRSTLSPAFTGSKMRSMCPFIVECGQQVVEYLKKECNKRKSNNGSGIDIEMRDLYTRFGTDVIATSAFGCKVNSLEDKENDFYVTGMKMTTFTNLQSLKTQIIMAVPKIASYFNIKILDPSITSFFKNIFTSTVKYREENNVFRPDMINILMEVKKGNLKYETQDKNDDVGFATAEESEIGKTQTQSKRVWDDFELFSQAFIFFLAGFEPVSTALSFTTMELGLNPDVQDKLREEVDATYPKDGVMTYETIQKMPYLDMVISEGLRLWPSLPFQDRLCVKPYHIPGKFGGKNSLTIEKGQIVILPAFSIHSDPKYWEEPRKFDPERFSAENKHKIIPSAYFPFGVGPRNCIGSRFALMEIKVIIYYLIRNFKLVSTKKTMNPMKLSDNSMVVSIQGGFWLQLIPRDDLH